MVESQPSRFSTDRQNPCAKKANPKVIGDW